MLQSDKNLYIATLKSVLESTQSPSSQPLQQQNQKIEIVINLLSKLPSGEYEQVITGINDLRKTFLQKGEE
jgi:hypothetical protein